MKKTRQPIPVTIDGVEYASLSEAGRALGKTPATIRANYLSSGKTKADTAPYFLDSKPTSLLTSVDRTILFKDYLELLKKQKGLI